MIPTTVPSCVFLKKTLFRHCFKISKKRKRFASCFASCSAKMAEAHQGPLTTFAICSVSTEPQFAPTSVGALGIKTVGDIVTRAGICRTLVDIWQEINQPNVVPYFENNVLFGSMRTVNVRYRCTDERQKNMMALGRILCHSVKKASYAQSNEFIDTADFEWHKRKYFCLM